MKATRFPLVFGDSAVLFTAKKCQTLNEYSEKTVRGAMGCDVLETNYNYSRIQGCVLVGWKLHCFGARRG